MQICFFLTWFTLLISFYTPRKHQKTADCLKSWGDDRPVAWNKYGWWCSFHKRNYFWCLVSVCPKCSFLSKSLVEKRNELYQVKNKFFPPILYFWSSTIPPPFKLSGGVIFYLFETVVYLETRKISKTFFVGSCALRGLNLFGEIELHW